MNYIESYYIGAYWGPRSESMETCVNKIILFYTTLSSFDEKMKSWYKGASSRKKSMEYIYKFEFDEILKAITKKRKQPFDEVLGYNFGCWNGSLTEEESLGISAWCNSTSKFTSNSVVMNFPYKIASCEKYFQHDFILQIFKLVIDIWDPDYMIMTSTPILDKVRINKDTPKTGWFTYLRNDKKAKQVIESVADFVEIIHYGNGVIVVIGNTCASINNIEQMEKINQFQIEIDKAYG